MKNDLLKAYKFQKAAANKRNILWHFTFETWLKVWTDSGTLDQRGRERGCFCMSRYGDSGPYSPDNVFIQLHSKNLSDAHKGKKLSVEQKRKVGNRKLTESEVKRIRQLAAEHLTQKVIAGMFNVKQGTISKVVGGKNWGHVH